MPAQRAFTIAEYLGWTDEYARAIAAVLAATGDEDTPTTAAAYAAAVRNAITALADPDEAAITIALLPAASLAVGKFAAPTFIQVAIAGFNSAILTSLGSDLNAWITLQAAGRVQPLFKRYGNPYLLPVNAFPPVTVLGTVDVDTSSHVGNWVVDPETLGKVDTLYYGDAALEVEVLDGATGVPTIVATVIGTDFAGAAQSHVATISTEAAEGAKFDVGSATDLFATVTNVTFTGGTTGDKFRVQTKVDRAL